jgi:tetratricopeptide (TPR) repeat protein
MPEPETRQSVPVDDPASATATVPQPGEGQEAEPEPEPWTAARVSEWNAYYDVYVKWAALILVFMVACNYVTDSHVWLHLKVGQLIARQSAPVTTDVFSYTQPGQRWFNIPWLFQWFHAVLYDFVYGLVPVDAIDPTANRAKAEQIAVGTLVVFDGLIRFLTAWLILKFRHRGPGLWWSAICMTLALGVAYHPIVGVLMGGIAGPSFVTPLTWGLFLFAIELLILFRAFFQGRGFGLWFLAPLFLFWANVDESFLFGLVVLATSTVGYLLDRGRLDVILDRPATTDELEPAAAVENSPTIRPVGPAVAMAITVTCALVCLANPSTWHAFVVAATPFNHLFQARGNIAPANELGFFSATLREQLGEDWYPLALYFLGVLALGLGSFLLNVRRFSWARFLPFAAMAALWAAVMHANAAFALVFAWVLAPNGQEWYQDRFGVQGRLGGRWTFWSTGGRLVTLTLIFLIMSKDITGWGNTSPDIQFGLGYHPDSFTLEAADFLDRHNEIKGNVLNTSMHQGDILIWKTGSKRKTFVDGRAHLFPLDLLEQWRQTRKALSDDIVADWKPLLDKYEISAVMVEPSDAPNTHKKLLKSPNWVPFYDDGRIVMFGRADAPESDLAFFKANKLDADLLAYRTTHPVAGAERPPNPTTWIDGVFQNRTLSRPQSRTESALRWLVGQGNEATSSVAAQQPLLPDPARCILAIQEARTALAHSPDDWIAFRRLKDAYRSLMIQENAMLAGIPIKPENSDRIMRLDARVELLVSRLQQRVTALNYAIMTTPPPVTSSDRVELAGLNLELWQLYLQLGARDLARDQLKAVVENAQPGDHSAEMMASLQKQFTQLDKAVKDVDDKISDYELEHSAGPIEKSVMALNQGNTGRAIAELAEAERNLDSTAIVKPRLVDLYCNTGQPEKAMELLAVGALEDPNLGAEPGSGAFRQGRVYFLLGNYLSAATLWHERAIPRARADRSGKVLSAATALTRGEALQTTNSYLTLPASLRQQATWLYDLGMCQLEAGLPEEAAESLSKALTLSPDIGVRPIAAYYLEKLGKPVPAQTKSASIPATTAGAAADRLNAEILTPPPIGKPAGTTKPVIEKGATLPAETAKDKAAVPKQ